MDISENLFEGAEINTARFGNFTIKDSQFKKIIANDVLEHIPNLTAAMTNCLRLLMPGGTFHINVPYDLSLGAWQDPTHVRAFNENSWLYYTEWFWYLNWSEARFDLVSITYNLSELGKAMNFNKENFSVIARTPRAIDSMYVVLRKRYLLDSEKEKIRTLSVRPWDEHRHLRRKSGARSLCGRSA